MKKSLYLETSVVGAYLDNGEPFRRDLTIRWWEHELADYAPYISPLVVRELERTEEPRRAAYLNLIRDVPLLKLVKAAMPPKATSRGVYFIANMWPMRCTLRSHR